MSWVNSVDSRINNNINNIARNISRIDELFQQLGNNSSIDNNNSNDDNTNNDNTIDDNTNDDTNNDNSTNDDTNNDNSTNDDTTNDDNTNIQLTGVTLLSNRDPSISLGDMKNVVAYINSDGTIQYFLDDTTVPFEVYSVSVTLLGDSPISNSLGVVSDFKNISNSDTIKTNVNGSITKKIQVPLFFKLSFSGGKFSSNNRDNSVNFSILMNKSDVLTNPSITVSPLSTLLSRLTLLILTSTANNESYPFTSSYSTALNIIETYIQNTLTSDDSNNFSNIDYISTENSNLMVLNYLILNNVYNIATITSLDKNAIFDKIAQYFLNMYNSNSIDVDTEINNELFFQNNQLTNLISYINQTVNVDTQINSDDIDKLINNNTIIFNNALNTFSENVSSNQNILSSNEILYRYNVQSYNLNQLLDDGFTLSEIKNSGINVKIFIDAGYTLQQLINDVGYTDDELKLLKTPENNRLFTNEEIITSGLFTVDELRDTFTIQEISTANDADGATFFTVNDIILGGYSVSELKTAGYTAKQMYDSEDPIINFTVENMYNGGFTDSIELYTAGYSALDISNYWVTKNVSPPLSPTTVSINPIPIPNVDSSTVYIKNVNGVYDELGAKANTYYKQNIPLESTSITYQQNGVDNVETTVSINELDLSKSFTVVYSFVDEVGTTTTATRNVISTPTVTWEVNELSSMISLNPTNTITYVAQNSIYNDNGLTVTSYYVPLETTNYLYSTNEIFTNYNVSSLDTSILGETSVIYEIDNKNIDNANPETLTRNIIVVNTSQLDALINNINNGS
jgi:hypothetical protein